MNYQGWLVMAWLAFGAAFGAVYLRVLASNVRLYCGGRTTLAALLHLLRFAGAAAILTVLAKNGVAVLLSSFLGFQLIRLAGCSGAFSVLEPLT